MDTGLFLGAGAADDSGISSVEWITDRRGLLATGLRSNEDRSVVDDRLSAVDDILSMVDDLRCSVDRILGTEKVL
jgi:hypothetical protein